MPWYDGDFPPSYKNQPPEVKEKAVEIANALLQDGAEEGIAIATGLKQARELLKNHKEKIIKRKSKKLKIMENNKDRSQSDQEDSNQNANSAYSGSGGMQPGGSKGEAGPLNDYDQKETDDKTENNTGGKSIDEATDPSKLSSL